MADLIDRQKAIEAVHRDANPFLEYAASQLEKLPTIEIVRCRECRWWDKKDDSPLGYCHAAKHCHYSRNWEIQIYRTYPADFFCANGERRRNDE